LGVPLKFMAGIAQLVELTLYTFSYSSQSDLLQISYSVQILFTNGDL